MQSIRFDFVDVVSRHENLPQDLITPELYYDNVHMSSQKRKS